MSLPEVPVPLPIVLPLLPLPVVPLPMVPVVLPLPIVPLVDDRVEPVVPVVPIVLFVDPVVPSVLLVLPLLPEPMPPAVPAAPVVPVEPPVAPVVDGVVALLRVALPWLSIVGLLPDVVALLPVVERVDDPVDGVLMAPVPVLEFVVLLVPVPGTDCVPPGVWVPDCWPWVVAGNELPVDGPPVLPLPLWALARPPASAKQAAVTTVRWVEILDMGYLLWND